MAEDVILTQIKLEGSDQVQDDLRRIGEAGNRAFEQLAQGASRQFDQVTTALTKVSESLDRFSRARIEINTDRANQALENIARVTDQLSRQLANLGQPGARSLQDFNATAQRSQQEVRALEGATTSAFNNIGQSGVSAFTLVKNTIEDTIRAASNYKTAIAGIFTGGLIGFAVNEIQNAVKSFNDLKKAASDAKIPFDDYQKANFLLRELGVSAKDSTELLSKLGQRAEDFKKVQDALNVPAGMRGKRLSIEVDPNTGAVTKTIIEDLAKIGELTQKFKSGGFGDPGSFEALHKYRAELDALQKSTAAAAQSHIILNPFVKTLGNTINDTIKAFTLAPTTDNLKKVVEEVNKLGDSGKRVEEFKKAFGGAEAPAKALEEALNTNTLDEFMTRWEKISRLKKEDEKSTEALDKANKNFSQAMFEVGAATEQGRISLGLMFAPTLAPAIDAIANGIRSLNLDFRKLASDLGKDIGPAIEQIFNIFKGKDVDTSKTGMFKPLIDGFKGLVDAAQPALDVFNSFFQTSLSLSDVGIGAALTGLVGGFNALAIAIGAVFTVSTPGMEKFKDSLKSIGIDIDAIKERVLNFARGLREAFRDPGQRSEMFENIKKSLEGLPALILGVVAAFALLRTGAGLLGRALGAAFGVKISAEATLLGVALAQISGVLPTINTLASTFAGIMVGLNASLSILVGLLGWPIILAIGLTLLVTNFTKAKEALDSFAKALNAAFGTDISGTQLLVGILGVIAVRLGLAAIGAGLFSGAITAAGTAAGTAAAGGFAALLATLTRVAAVVLAAVAAWQLWKDVTGTGGEAGALERKMDETTKKFQQGGFGDPKSAEAIEKYRAELSKLQQEFEKTGKASGKVVDPASTKSFLDQITGQFAEFMKGIDTLSQKGAESRAKDLVGGTGAKASEKPKQTPEEIAELKKDLGSDETTVTVNGRVFRVRKVGGESKPEAVPLPRPRPEPAPADRIKDAFEQLPTGPQAQNLAEVKTATVDVGSEIRNNIEWQKLYNEKIKELNELLATAAERLKKLAPEGGKPETGLLAGEARSSNVQNVKELSPEEFRRFQDLTDQTNKITEILGGKLDKVVQEQAALRAAWPEVDARFKAIDALVEKSLGQPSTTAPAQDFVSTTKQELTAAETALAKVTGLVGTGLNGLRGTADLANKTFDNFIGGLRQTANTLTSGQQSLNSLDNTTKSLDGGQQSLTQTTKSLDDAAKRLRDTFDSFTKKILELRDKVAPSEKKPGGVEDDVTKGKPRTIRVLDPKEPGGFRDVPVPGGPSAPGGTPGGGPGGQKFLPYIDPSSGEYTNSPTGPRGPNLPVNPATGEPLLTGPQRQPLKTGKTGRLIDPATGEEFPRSTGPVFSRPSDKKDLGPRLVPQEMPTPSPTPTKPIPVVPVTPDGTPTTPAPDLKTEPPKVEPLPPFDFNKIIDDALKLIPKVLEEIPLPRPRPEQAPSEPPTPTLDGTDDRIASLTENLNALASAAQNTTTALEPVTPALEQVSTAAQSVPTDVQQAGQSFEQIDFSQAEQTVDQFVQAINDAFSKLSAPQAPQTAATGGLITGPGTDTSDSIPILASANEFMVRAAAVRHYGRDFMYRVNSMSFPRLSMGGLIDHINSPLSGSIRLPRFAEGGPVEGSNSSVPVHVNFEGRRVFSASAPRSSIEQLKRESLLQKVRSGGPSPFWVE